MPLTDTAIKALKPKDKSYKTFDGGGLYVEVAPAGGKWWRLKYRFEGKEKRISLGVYPAVSLKTARDRREEAKKLLAQGIDPAVQRKEEKIAVERAEQEQLSTFEVVAREWHSRKTVHLSESYRKQILSRLENMLFPYLGSKPFMEIEPIDILNTVRHAEDRGAIETAHRLLQLCGQICRYARLVGYAKYDVAAGLSEALPPVVKKHLASLTDPKDVGHLLNAIDEYQGDLSIIYAMKILPYVFVRSSELRGAKWVEFDFTKAEWTIPAPRMKMRKPHIVPLATQVVSLLEELREHSGQSEYVFPSPFSSSKCISDMGLLNALRRMGYGKEQMTIHGFRSTASTLLNELGYNRDWIERQLAHGERNAVRAAYNYAEYLPERKLMMQEWAGYLDALKTSNL